MAFRLYITPEIIEDGSRYPKYFVGQTWGGIPYGFQPIYIVAANLAPAVDASIVANSDVFAFPFDLDVTVGGGNVQAARDAFELALIPAEWIGGNMLWREVARIVAGMFQFMRRLETFLPTVIVIDSSTRLNIQWSVVPTELRSGILLAAASLGYDTSFIADNVQVRTILKNFADAWGSAPFDLNGFVF